MTTLLDPLRLERTAPEEPRHPRLVHDWLLVAALVAFYAALQSAFVRPPQVSDQLHYLVDAANLPQVSWPAHQALRIGLTIPVWILTRLFGYSEAAYYGVPYLTTATLVASTYWLGRLLDSRAAGVISGLLIIANPLVLDESSQLLPDLPAATLVVVAVTLLLWQWRRTGVSARLRGVDHAVLVGVGALLGWAYLVREFVVFWYPVVALVIVVLRLPRSWWLRIAAGLGGAFAFELLWGLVVLGNPFARISAALNQPASEPWRVAQRTDLIARGIIPDTHLEMLTALPRAVVEFRAGWIVIVLFVVLIAAASVVRAPGLRLLALWTVVPMGLLMATIQFAWLFDNRILRAEKLRYWLPVLPPLVVGGVVAILALGRWLGGDSGRRAGVVAVSMLTVVSLALTGNDLDDAAKYTRTGKNHMLEFREWAATSGQTCTTLWVDADQWRATTRWVPMYLHTFWGTPVWEGEVRHLNTGDDFVDISDLDGGALVRAQTALQRRRIEGLPIPDYLRRPPSSWPVLLVTNRDRIRVFAVGGSTCARP